MEDRDTKIANFKMKKLIENNLDLLKDYKDEETKRKFYHAQLQLSIMQTFENIRMTEMEMMIHAHAATLTPAQIQ